MRERVRRLAHRLTASLMDECQAGWQGRGEEHPSNRIQSGAAERGTGGGWGGGAEGEGEGGCSGRKEKCSGDEGGRERGMRKQKEKAAAASTGRF